MKVQYVYGQQNIRKNLQMCIVQQRKTKKLFTFQPIKLPVSMTVKSANPAVT